MLIQIILSIIEDLIISFFVVEMVDFKKNKTYFVLSNTILCAFITYIFNKNTSLTNYLPFCIVLNIMILLRIFKKKLSLNDLIVSLIGPILVIITDLISLLLCSFLTHFDLSKIVNDPHNIILASFFAKLILLLICLFISNRKPKFKNDLNYKKWGILCPIGLLIFSEIYVLGDAIVSNSLSTLSLYYLIINLIILSALIIILFYIIQKESINEKQIELTIQKEKYISQNKSLLLKLHDEISVIDHNNMYTLLQIKNLIKQQKYNEIEEIIENNIFKLRKYKNIICTGNPLFDQAYNKEINYYSMQNYDLKTICSISNKDFQIEKDEINFIIDSLKYFISISKIEKTFTINISSKLNFLTIYFLFYHSKDFDIDFLSDLKNVYSSDNLKFNSFIEEELTHIKIVLEME